MKILVLGAGSIGSVFGGFLAESGHDVYLIGRKLHTQAIAENGLLINGIWGQHLVDNLKVFTSIENPAANADIPFDLALLTVKSYDTESILKELKRNFSDPPPVVSLQNGLGNIEKIEALLGRKKTIVGRVIFGVEFIKSGHVKVTVSADRTLIGGLKGGISKDFLNKVAATFNAAGLNTAVTDDIKRFVWGKVLYNCALNGLATIIDVNYGKLLSSEGTRAIMGRIIDEIFIVAGQKKIKLDRESSSEYKKLLFEELIPKTFEHHPSMLQDIKRGHKTEIDALNGAIVQIGREAGITLPCNWAVTQFVKARELLNSQ